MTVTGRSDDKIKQDVTVTSDECHMNDTCEIGLDISASPKSESMSEPATVQEDIDTPKDMCPSDEKNV